MSDIIAIDPDHEILPAGMNGAPNWALALYQQGQRIETQNASILEVHDRILSAVEELKPQVLEVVAGLQSNPMFKMLLGGKK